MIWYNIEDKGEIMKSDHLKESKNIEDRRGQSGGSYSSGRSGGNVYSQCNSRHIIIR